MIPTPTLETNRLVLKPLTLADAPAVQKLFPQWEIVKYLNNTIPWPYPADGVETYYRDIMLPAVAAGNQWQWGIFLKDNPTQIIGAIGLMLDKGGDNRGFWLGLPWHGKGLMTEACGPVNDFWFNTLNKPVLRTGKAVGNKASSRVSEKQGMRLIGTERRKFVSGEGDCEIWEMTRDEWNARRKNPAAPAPKNNDAKPR